MVRESTRWRTPEVSEPGLEPQGQVGVRLGRLRCKAKFSQGYGIEILGLRKGGWCRGKRNSHSQ